MITDDKRLYQVYIHRLNDDYTNVDVTVVCPKKVHDADEEVFEQFLPSLKKVSLKLRNEGEQAIRSQGYLIFCQWKHPWVVYAICDPDYKMRVGFQLTARLLESDKTKKKAKELMKTYESSNANDKIAQAHKQLEEVKFEVMNDIDKMLDNSNSTDILQQSTSLYNPDSLTSRCRDMKKKTAKASLLTRLRNLFSSEGRSLRELERQAARSRELQQAAK